MKREVLTHLLPPGEAAPGDDAALLRTQLDEARQALATRTAELGDARRGLELLHATLDSTTDGVLSVNFSDRSMYFNISFVEMWRLPEDALSAMTEDELLSLQAAQLVDPDYFIAQI